MVKFIKLEEATAPYKWRVILLDEDGKEKSVRFGRRPYFDFTSFPKEVREQKKINYLNRHKKREDWGKSGIFTAGFWSRWILWNKSSIQGSLRDVRKRFSI